MREKEMIMNSRSSWLFQKLALQVPCEKNEEQNGEFGYWCYGVKGK